MVKKFFKRSTKIISLMILFSLLFSAGMLFAEEEASSAPAHLPIDFVWLLVAGFLVFMMQAGFAMVETGFTRAKNAGNIIMKNVMDFSIGSIAYFAVGYGIMYGTSKLGGLFGASNFFLSSANPATNEGLWEYASWFFQVVFAATAATIVSGAMAGRTKFVGYLIFSFVISLVIYPVSGHWIWGGGWLAKLGMIDFAGSTVVHSVGGWVGLVGALVLGPRLGKYSKAKKAKAIPGHSIPLAALGVFLLWFGWFGFNAGSTLGYSDIIGHVAMTTNLAAAAGAILAMFTVWVLNGKPDVSMSLNGALAGLVAITAPCSVVSPVSAVIIGAVGGVLVVLSVEFFDKVLKIDDPVGAVSVHGINGVWGTLAVGLFAQSSYAQASGFGAVNGLFFGGGSHQLGIQAIGVLAVAGWTIAAATVLFLSIKYTIGLRVSREEEMKGLDIGEHGMESYGGFQIIN